MIRIREAVPDERSGWDDLVRRFPNHRVTHTRTWIDSLAASGYGRPVFLIYEDDGDIVGLLPGLLMTVGRWRVFGSPLPGWQSVSMGPAFDPARVGTAALIAELVPYLERRHRVDHIELLHSGLEAGEMEAAGFRRKPVFTYRAPLYPGDETRTFKSLKDSARRNVKRAERLGLVVRAETDDRFVDEHYDQLVEVYRRGGYAIPFTVSRVRECFRRLRASGNLLALSVSLPGGRVNIATGMFLIEGRELLLWMWAHRAHYRWYRPTELMTWTAMREAVRRGCDTFDLMGGGGFKTKFGAEPDTTKFRWIRSRRPWLTHARDLAETAYRWQQALRGRAARLVEIAASALRARRRSGPRPPACVLGDIDLVRTLGLSGIPSIVVAPPGAPARCSRHTRGTLPWADAWERPDEVVETLLRFSEAAPEPPVLFYQDDAALLLISRHRDRLRHAFRFVIPEAELVEQLVDKSRFQALATRLRLPVPAARAFQPSTDPAASPESLGLGFPIILKPLTRLPSRWEPVAGAGKAVRVDSLDALRAIWPRLAGAKLSVLAQELIPGPEHRIESYHVYVDADGEIVGEFTGRKIRTWPVAFGDSTAVEITDTADVAALGRELVRRLDLRGVAKFDFKRGPDGLLYLLEVNPRFNLWHHVGARAGVNLPALVYRDLTGEPRLPVARARAGTRWCKPWKDVLAARTAGTPLWRWLPWWVGCDAQSGFAWDDPWPLARAGLSRLATPRSNGARPRERTPRTTVATPRAPTTPSARRSHA
jgi:D-aspartate ligase